MFFNIPPRRDFLILMTIKGIHHIKLTVSNLEISREFYSRLPGFKLVAEYPDFYMFSCGKFNLGLTTHKEKLKLGKFEEFNVGLDHISFEVDTSSEEALTFLDANSISHGEVEKLSNNLYVLAFRDPDNIQLEFSWRQK